MASSNPVGRKQKKQPQNAFYFYMLDFRKREEMKGVRFNSLAEVSAPAGREWQKMSPTERKPYELKAQEAKQKAKIVKYTSLGEPINNVVNREIEQKENKRLMETTIENLIQSNLTGEGYADLTFYVGNINYYCQVSNNGRYYPAEISIVRFSLRNGVDLEDVFHVIINSGEVKNGEISEELPIGYRLAAQTHANESHQIPPPPHNEEMGEWSKRELRSIFHQMLLFLRDKIDDKDPYPPIYVDNINEKTAENVLKWMQMEFNNEEILKVYSLGYLFYCLRNAAHTNIAKENVFISKSIAENELERDVYDYVKGISCRYHYISDAYPHCSLSKAIRSVYIICDHCCADAGIELRPGLHVPATSDPTRLVKRPTSRISATWDEEKTNPPLPEPKVTKVPAKTDHSKPNGTLKSTLRCPVTTSRVHPPVEEIDESVNQPASSWNQVEGPNIDDFPSLNGNDPVNHFAAPLGAWGNRSSSVASSASSRGRGRGRFLQLQNNQPNTYKKK